MTAAVEPTLEEIIKIFEDNDSNLAKTRNSCVKKITSMIETCAAVEIELAATKLTKLFFETELKNPLKKTLSSVISILQNRNADTVHNAFSRIFKELLDSFDSLSSTLLLGESILACLDIFEVGRIAVHDNFESIFRFISRNLRQLKEQLQPLPSPQETTNLFVASQTLLKALSLTLQEYDASKKCAFNSTLLEVYYLVSWFLVCDDVVLNCKLSAGIAYVNLTITLSPDLLEILDKGTSYESKIGLPILFLDSSLSQVSQLSLWNGLLVSLSLEQLCRTNSVDEFLLIKIFKKIHSLGNLINEESAVLISFSRGMLTWTEYACQVVKSTWATCDLKMYFDGNSSSVMKKLLNYVFANWDHTVDSLRHHSKAIFRNVINLHILCVVDDQDTFLPELIEKLLNLPWHTKGKYGALCHLVEAKSASIMLETKPNIMDEIVLALSELSLAPHVSDFLTVMCKAHHSEVDLESWEKLWLDPIMTCLCLGNKVQKSSAQQYVLSKILQVEPRSLQYLVTELASEKFKDRERSMCVTIACVKTAKSVKIPYKIFGTSDNSLLWKNCLPLETIKVALCHVEEQVRLDALSILCDSPKSTEAFLKEELELLKFFLIYNLNIQSPAFRQKMVSHLKKMFNRIKLNSIIELRKAEKAINGKFLKPNVFIENYMEFLNWLNSFLLQNLFPEANFPRRCTVLQLLVIMKETFTGGANNEGNELAFRIDIDRYFCRTLWDLFRDTYENNKEAVLELMESIPLAYLGLEDEDAFVEVFETSLSLASSSRPPDSVTAAYMFRIISKSNLCVKLVSRFCSLTLEDLTDIPDVQSYAILRVLVSKLEEQLAIACLSLLQAATSGPLYGIMTCIRTLLDNTKLLSSSKNFAWRELLARIINICLETGAVVQPVVCNASPEGHLPMDTDLYSISHLQSAIQRAIGRRFTTAASSMEVNTDSSADPDNALTVDMVKTRAVTAQMLLLCSWRAHKEVSLLLGLLAEKYSVGEDGLIQSKEFLEIGNYFTKQLAEIKHRGAFEQAYVGFTKLCYRLWRCEDPELHSLPERWLNELIEMISENKSKTDSSTGPTRRSAGVPFIVQALLITEPDATNRRCFKKALPAILELTELHFDSRETIENSRIHALNVLRTLYRDAHLGEDIMPFVADGIKASILGFKSDNWGVRNSSTLLFTTLVTRIFGVNRSRNEPQKKNCLTGRVFFQRFPQLFEFLYTELEIATESLTTQQSSALHPILLLLSRLYPSPVEGSSSYVKLACFVPLVEKCASKSPIWWTRNLAAQALVPLLPVEHYERHLDSCFLALSRREAQNEIHGKLLQILRIFEDTKNLPEVILASFSTRIDDWLSGSLWLLSKSHNNCEETRCSFLDVLLCISNGGFSISTFVSRSLINSTTETIKEGKVCLSQATALKVALNVSLRSIETSDLDSIVIASLNSNHYELQVVVLDFLSWLFSCDSEMREIRSIDSAPLNKEHDFVCLQMKKDEIQRKLQLNPLFYQTLLHLAFEENPRPWCLTEVFLILCKIPLSKELESSFDVLLERLSSILDKTKLSTFDDVSVSMLLYSGCITFDIFKNEKQIRGEISETVRKLIEKWAFSIASSSAADNSSAMRLAVTKTLVSNVELMTDPFLGTSCFALWDGAIALLQDDEPEIRNGIVDLVVKIGNVLKLSDSEVQFPYPVVSTLSMDLLLSYFVAIHGSVNSNYCLSLLITWSLRCDLDSLNSEDDADEQPFDKGEMNVFLEEITLNRSACRQISILLQNNSIRDSHFQLVKLQWLLSDPVSNDKDMTDLAALLENCAQECLGFISQLSACDMSHVYLCHLVDGLSVKIYQRLLLMKVVLENIRVDLTKDFKSMKEIMLGWRYPNSFIRGIDSILNEFLS